MKTTKNYKVLAQVDDCKIYYVKKRSIHSSNITRESICVKLAAALLFYCFELLVQDKYKDIQHYSDVTIGAMASQITSLTIVYSGVYSGADQRKHQSSASLPFVRGIPQWTVNSPHKWPVTRKMLPFNDLMMWRSYQRISPTRQQWNRKHLISWRPDAMHHRVTAKTHHCAVYINLGIIVQDMYNIWSKTAYRWYLPLDNMTNSALVGCWWIFWQGTMYVYINHLSDIKWFIY